MRVIPRLLLALGVLVFGSGVWLMTSDAPAKDAARVAALPRANVAGLATLAPGTAILLEGRLVAKTPAGPRQFIAFHQEAFLRVESSGASQGRQVWQRTDTVRPAIAVESGDATAEVVNRDYLLAQWPHQEMTDAVPRYVSMVETTQRFLGFKAGDVVTVDGRVVDAMAGVPRVEAATLFGGNAAAYVASVRSGTTTFKVVGGVFTGLGAVLVVVGSVWLRATRRPAVDAVSA